MRKFIAIFTLGILLAALRLHPAEAQSYPELSKLVPYTPEANYMSIPGYLRWQYYFASGRWITREVAGSFSTLELERLRHQTDKR